MDPAAITGLAIKLDFTTVKLKKTGIVSEQAGGGGEVSGEAEASIALGEEMNTKHNMLLLMVKGMPALPHHVSLWDMCCVNLS